MYPGVCNGMQVVVELILYSIEIFLVTVYNIYTLQTSTPTGHSKRECIPLSAPCHTRMLLCICMHTYLVTNMGPSDFQIDSWCYELNKRKVSVDAWLHWPYRYITFQILLHAGRGTTMVRDWQHSLILMPVAITHSSSLVMMKEDYGSPPETISPTQTAISM